MDSKGTPILWKRIWEKSSQLLAFLRVQLIRLIQVWLKSRTVSNLDLQPPEASRTRVNQLCSNHLTALKVTLEVQLPRHSSLEQQVLQIRQTQVMALLSQANLWEPLKILSSSLMQSVPTLPPLPRVWMVLPIRRLILSLADINALKKPQRIRMPR